MNANRMARWTICAPSSRVTSSIEPWCRGANGSEVVIGRLIFRPRAQQAGDPSQKSAMSSCFGFFFSTALGQCELSSAHWQSSGFSAIAG